MKIVEFIKSHNYGGIPFAKGDKLELPDARAAALVKVGAAKEPKAKVRDE